MSEGGGGDGLTGINSGKSKWGVSNGGLRPLSAICAQSSTIVHFGGPFGPLSKGNFRHKTTTIVGNRGQLWTSTFSPHLDFPDKCGSLRSAGKRQESATLLQRSFFNVPVQFFACCSAAFGKNDFRIAEKRMLKCNFCSATFRTLRAQRLKKFKILKFSSETENFKRATHQGPTFSGEF